MKCIDCGGTELSTPDNDGFLDCFTCGAAWNPTVWEWSGTINYPNRIGGFQ